MTDHWPPPSPDADAAESAESAGSAASRVGHLLIVCTGNVCRSPYIERRLAQLLGHTGIVITSAGTDALVGAPIEPSSASRLRAVSAEPDDFAARLLTPAILDEVDLVLTATREHRAAAVRLQPKALRYTFTLGDFSDLVRDVRLGFPADGESWVSYVARQAYAARGNVPPRDREDSDIVDPYRRPEYVYDQMVSQIEREIGPVIDALIPRR
jgi:protein-tyrosine phosphatase